MIFSGIELAKRLEGAEGQACAMFAEARRRQFPQSGAEWMKCAGAFVVFDGVDSPVTQTFGLGIFEPVTPAALDEIENFFWERGAPVQHEVSPLAGVPALDLLCSRGYRPIEVSSVMFQPVRRPEREPHQGIAVRIAETADDVETWARTSAQGWASEHPELESFLTGFGAILAGREGSYCFLASLDGQPAAAGALSVHDGAALFAGASTLPAFRRRGLQAALLAARMEFAAEGGCDLAVMVAEAGSGSQRNAERQGFRIAYTRTKWQLPVSGPL